MNIDPLQYIKDIQALYWRGLGYSDQMVRVLNGQNSSQPFLDGSSMSAYFEEGGFNGSVIQSISAKQIITSELVAGINVGGGSPSNYLKIDGPKQRIVSVVNNVTQIVFGKGG